MTRHSKRLSLLFTVALMLGTGCAGKTLQARMAHGEEKASQAESNLDDAQKRLDEKNPDRAERLINDAEKALAHPDVGYYPERSLLLTRVGETRARLDAVRAEMAWRAQEEKIDKQQHAIDEVVAKLKTAMALLKPETLSRRHLDDAEGEAEDLQDLLNDGKALEKAAPRYEEYARPQWTVLMESAKELKTTAAVLKFKEGPLERSAEAQKRLADAKKQPKHERLEPYKDAHEALSSCRMEGSEMLAQSPGLDKRTLVTPAGKLTQPKAVVQACVAELAKLDKLIPEAKKAAAAKATAAAKAPVGSKNKKKPTRR